MITTDRPRFWLSFSVYGAHEVRVDDWFSHYRYGEKHTITVEVDEPRYRTAYLAEFPYESDPIPDWWRSPMEVASGNRRAWYVERERGGFITYWDEP